MISPILNCMLDNKYQILFVLVIVMIMPYIIRCVWNGADADIQKFATDSLSLATSIFVMVFAAVLIFQKHGPLSDFPKEYLFVTGFGASGIAYPKLLALITSYKDVFSSKKSRQNEAVLENEASPTEN